MNTANIMSFDEFRRFLSDTLGVVEAALRPEASFLVDLAIDSIKIVELVLQIERQLGVTMPSDAVWEILTVGDAYNYYISQLRSGSAPT